MKNSLGTLPIVADKEKLAAYFGGKDIRTFDPENRDYFREAQLRGEGIILIPKGPLAELIGNLESVESFEKAANDFIFEIYSQVQQNPLALADISLEKDQKQDFQIYYNPTEEAQTFQTESTPSVEKKVYKLEELPQQPILKERQPSFTPLQYRQQSSLEYRINHSAFSSNYSPLEHTAFTTPITPYQRVSSYIPRSRRYH